MKKTNRPNRGIGSSGVKRGMPKGRTSRYEFGGDTEIKYKLKRRDNENK